VVSHYWRKALRDSLVTLEEPGVEARALACHLTLFNPNRREHFVPGRPQDFLGATDGPVGKVARVVVLIDDIYDMYARLSDGEVLDEEQQKLNYNDFVFKLIGKSLLDPVEGSPELLRLEVRRRALESLAAWRRAELVQAEALANALGNVPLTVLGVKHRVSALESLILNPSIRVAYLSHKITEARKFNRGVPAQVVSQEERWPDFVREINSLSPPFEQAGIILLHPTAIDELRMGPAEKPIGLTDRWPLQEEDKDLLLYSPPPKGTAPEHTDLLGAYSSEADH
jgi:hypothetical protein